jgi:hypothetical protein
VALHERWRAAVKRADGSRVQVGDTRFDCFYTSADTSAAREAVQSAVKATEAKTVR